MPDYRIVRHFFISLITASVLAGCVTPDATPALVDPTGLVTYAHPSGVFTLELPPDWVVNDRSTGTAINVEFSPPGSPEPLLGVYVVTARADLPIATPYPGSVSASGSPELDAMIDAYRQAFYSEGGAAYREIARDAQPDGSLRIKFVLEAPGRITQHNDFIQVVGPYFVALRVQLSDDPAQMRTLSRVINTLQVNRDAGWMSGGETAQTAVQDAIGFASLNAWVDRNSGLEVVGQIVNNSAGSLEFIRIEALLYDAENRLLATQDNFVSSDLVQPGEYAPFAIVFTEGMPPGTIRYELHASARYADVNSQTFYGAGNFSISSQAEFDSSGFLVVSGVVTNQGGRTANLVKVLVTIFDEGGRVIGTDTTLVDVQRLAPGEASTFSVIFVELGGVPGTFVVTAQGVVEE